LEFWRRRRQSRAPAFFGSALQRPTQSRYRYLHAFRYPQIPPACARPAGSSWNLMEEKAERLVVSVSRAFLQRQDEGQMSHPRIIIVGGGFGGLIAAKALSKTPAHVILIDRANHHLFQPLLYQVATSVLNPGQIGFPIRELFRKQKNTTVILG